MYLLNAETDVLWELSPTESILVLVDLDVIITSPLGLVTYIDNAILAENYLAPTPTTPGHATFPYTPDIEGLWKIQLVVGTSTSYTVISKAELFVFDNSLTVNPIKNTPSGVNSAIEVEDSGGLVAQAATRLKFLGAEFTISEINNVVTITLTDYPVPLYQSPDAILAALEGALSASKLTAALQDRIDLVDGSGVGSVNARVQVVDDKVDAMSVTLNDPNSGLPATASIVDTLNTWVAEVNGSMVTVAGSAVDFTTLVGTNQTTIQEQTTSINGLSAQFTVKIDNNGYVSGFGLASEVVDGTPYSEFAILADQFSIAPTDGGLATAPFYHLTVETVVDGVVVPPGTYMTSAYIADGTITNLQIGNVIESADGGASWSIDKLGGISATSLIIRDTNDDIILDTDGNLSPDIDNRPWQHVDDSTFIDGGKIYTNSITADRFITTLEGDLNQALYFVKTVLGAGDEYAYDLVLADYTAGSSDLDSTYHFDYGNSMRLMTTQRWDGVGDVWDGGNTWSIPVESTGVFNSGIKDIGSLSNLQMSIEASTHYYNIATATVLVEAQYSLTGGAPAAEWGTDEGVFTDEAWEVCTETSITPTKSRWSGDLHAIRYFKFRITLTTSDTSQNIILHDLKYFGNVVNVYGSLVDQSIPAAGRTFTISGYTSIPAVTVTVQSGAGILIPVVSSKSATSFTVHLYNLSSVATLGTADIIIMGA